MAPLSGGDDRAKEAAAALRIILFCFLPSGKQQLMEKSFNATEIILNPTDPSSPSEQYSVVDYIIQIVAKDYETQMMIRMADLQKQA